MSTQVEINGASFLPIKDASKLVSYSRDYVARLAREQKIVASQIGRQWFIDVASLKNFAQSAELEQTVRKQQLSLERKREQIVKQEVTVIKNTTRGKVKLVKVRAQLAATLALSLGLMIGTGLYTSSALLPQEINMARLGSVSDVSVVEELPVVAVESFAKAEPQPTTLYSTVMEYPLFVDESEVRAMNASGTEGIFILPSHSTVETPAEIEQLFSDDVTVTLSATSSGVVEYQKAGGEVVEYPFVSVPVLTARVGNEDIE